MSVGVALKHEANGDRTSSHDGLVGRWGAGWRCHCRGCSEKSCGSERKQFHDSVRGDSVDDGAVRVVLPSAVNACRGVDLLNLITNADEASVVSRDVSADLGLRLNDSGGVNVMCLGWHLVTEAAGEDTGGGEDGFHDW